MDLMKKSGNDNKKVVSDFLTGEIVNKDDTVNIDPENPKLGFDNLEAVITLDKVREPIFFVPINRFVPINNILQTTKEPFCDAVFPTAKVFNKLAHNDKSIVASANAIIDQAIEVIMTNIYTIFNNGTILTLRSFYKNKDNLLVDEFRTCIANASIESNLYRIGRSIRDSITVANLNEDRVSIQNMMISSVCEVQTIVGTFLAQAMYDYVRNILLYEAVDLDRLFLYFDAKCKEKVDFREDTKKIIESAKYSVCVQRMLGIVTDDILRCEEIVEVNFVSMFYNLTDLAQSAIESGIYTKDNIVKTKHERPKEFLLDSFKY